jgi:hypothetical protein
MSQTRIVWHTQTRPDQAGADLILSALKSNRRTRHAEFRIAEPDETDGEGTISIVGNRVDKLIDPGEVRALIDACLE